MSHDCCTVYGPTPWSSPRPPGDPELLEKLRAAMVDLLSEIRVVDPLTFDDGEG